MPMQDATTDERIRNRILGQLSRSQWELLQPHSEMRPLKRGKPISSPSEPGARVVFPIDCIVSLRCELADGHGSEFAMVGNEGVVGISAFTSVEAQSTDAAVQCPGRALSVRTSVMRLMFDADPAFRCIVLRYMQALLNAASQTTTCYRHHGIEQQVARVLLAIHDRLDGVLLPLTHQVIAGMLGVRREGVTEATNALRRDGLIEYARGRIHLLDLRGLADRACECYAQIRDEYRRMSGER
jgi:CRP-like cAMP-binding protein